MQDREDEVSELNSDLQDVIAGIRNILHHTLKIDDTIKFSSLKSPDYFPPFQSMEFASSLPPEPSFFQKLWPGTKESHEKAVKQFYRDQDTFAENQKKLFEAHEREKAKFLEKVHAQHAEIDAFSEAYFGLNEDAIVTYSRMVLERSEYPDGYPQKFRVVYVPESKELVIEYQLPTAALIPQEEEFRYVKTKDEIVSKPRKAKEIKELYADLVAALSIRTIHEVIEADQANALEVVSFNGHVLTRDQSNGKKIKPCVVSLRVTKEKFNEIDLRHIDKKACLRSLGANVSASPDEMLAVKPFVDFDMVDKRFVEQDDILSASESRPNLMDLTPTEFEHLVSNLFQQLGLEAKLTRSSRDGGVDCVAFDNRPVLGGKVVIQAKRYRHTVGVAAVRDLYGTMQHEHANKGILVATSGYGPDAFEFAKDKPIELIGGSQLLYLLEQVGIEARIVFPVE